MNYPSKILLFGEYCVIQGSRALAIPFPHFYGKWIFNPNIEQESLNGLLDYLNERQFWWIDIQAFTSDLEKGLQFQSNIPIGYGIGSSGALCAALYDRYASKPKDLQLLQQRLAKIESCFHGNSSGIDPLVCYLKHPILIEKDKNIKALSALPLREKYQFFLVDTGISRKTAPLVEYYLDQCKDDDYLDLVNTKLQQQTEFAIEATTNNLVEQLFISFEGISQFQLRYFKRMIPSAFVNYWEQGLENREYYLKLCGAGGGGFLLGITNNFDRIKSYFKPSTVIKI